MAFSLYYPCPSFNINQQLTISKRTNPTVLFLGTAAAEEKMFGLEKNQALERTTYTTSSMCFNLVLNNGTVFSGLFVIKKTFPIYFQEDLSKMFQERIKYRWKSCSIVLGLGDTETQRGLKDTEHKPLGLLYLRRCYPYHNEFRSSNPHTSESMDWGNVIRCVQLLLTLPVPSVSSSTIESSIRYT